MSAEQLSTSPLKLARLQAVAISHGQKLGPSSVLYPKETGYMLRREIGPRRGL